MIGVVIVGFLFGVLMTGLRIAYGLFTGTPSVVTANGWLTAPLKWGGWGILIGAIIGLIEVISGAKKLSETWGLSIVLSSVGGMFGGLGTWSVWTWMSSPAQPATPAAPTEGGK